MYVNSRYLRAVALCLPLISSASPLLTTTFEIEGTPVVIIEEVVATTTVTVHDGGPTDCAAGPQPPTETVVKGPNTFMSGPYVAPSGPIPDPTLLSPAIHPDIDPSNIANLHLGNKANLFYSAPEPSSNDVPVAFVNIPQMAYPCVILDHSSLISDLTCDATSLSVKFTSQVAFDTAQSHWSAEASSFVAITSNPACASASGQHEYVLINKITFSPDGLSATASITLIDLTQAVGDNNPVDVQLGNFTLSNGDGSGSFSAGGPGGPGGFTNSSSPPPSSTNPDSSSPDFDVALDELIGFLDVDDEAYWPQLYPGVTGETFSDFAGEDTGPALPAQPEKKRRSSQTHVYKRLERRGWFSSVVNTVKNAASTIANTASSVASSVAKAASDAKDKVVETAAKAYDALNPFTPRTFTPIDNDLNFATPKGSDSTPWGNGKQLLSKTEKGGAIAIYCVGCGVQGKIHVTGTVTFIVGKLSVSGNLKANGAVQAALELGIVASYTNTWSYTRDIATVPLSPLSIPGIITIGPQVTLSAGGSLTVEAVGQLLAGAVLDWPAIQATIDIGDLSASSASGFTPHINPVFEVRAAVSASADAFLTLAIGFGIDILAGTIKKQVALVEKPDINVAAKISAQAALSGGSVSGTIGDGQCAGVTLDVTFFNYVYADLAGSQKDINTISIPVLSKCFPIPKRRSLEGSVTARALRLGHGPEARVPAEPRTITENLSNMTAPVLNYTVLNAADGGLEVHYTDNGNLYAISDESYTANGIDDTILFAESVSGTVVGDSEGRLLHGYVDTLASLGVSRMRLADGNHLPKTSVMLTLAPVDPDGSGSSLMMAFDTAGNAYYPLLCVYENLYPKLFIAKDPTAGASVLEDPAQKAALTGGAVKECGFFGITDGVKGVNDPQSSLKRQECHEHS